MKIRIKGNSLRYRLTKTDVATLASDGFLKETVDFGDQQLVYALQLVDGGHLSSTYKNNTITLFAPKNMVNEFTDTDRVGFEGTDGHMYLLVEKDFTCLDNVAEDQSDNYPNPLAAKKI